MSRYTPQTMEKVGPQVEKKYLDLADKLDELQAPKNDNRGGLCVRGVIFALRRGNIDEAKAISRNEGDKIRSYPDIRDMIDKELFDGGLYPDLSKWFKDEEN